MDTADWNDWVLITSTIIKRTPIVATSGDNTIVSAVADKQILVLGLFLTATDDAVIRFEDGAGGTALTGQMNVYANASGLISGATGSLIIPYSTAGWFITSANTLLNMELSGGNVNGQLIYMEI